MTTSDLLRLPEASHALGVSEATLRNWLRLKIIKSESTKPLTISVDEITDFKTKIESGVISKLGARANRFHSASEKKTISHLSDKATQKIALDVLDSFSNKQETNLEVLFQVLVLILISDGVLPSNPQNNYTRQMITKSSVVLGNELDSWFKKMGADTVNMNPKLLNITIPKKQDDLLGVMYQGLLTEGEKSKLGSYYTPNKIISDAIDSLPSSAGKFLDPCCGTGQFLIKARRFLGKDFSNLYGFDKDPLAVLISRFNLLRENSYKETKLNIFEVDTILNVGEETLGSETSQYLNYFDVIATNPPWGSYPQNKKRLESIYKTKSGEMFSLVIEKSLKLAKPNAHLVFILPESFLKVATHKDIREIILKTHDISEIAELGKPFPGVMSNVVRINIAPKDLKIQTVKVSLLSRGEKFEILKDGIQKSKDLIIEYSVSPEDASILESIYKTPHIFLGHASEWGLGIVTGDNKNLLFKVKTDDLVPVLTGKEIEAFVSNPATKYLKYEIESFQQFPSNNIFDRPEKLFYRFISKNLVFCYDDERQLSLNSANVLIPNLDGIPIKVALGFLNSKVFQYVFMKKFYTYKILKNNLMELPFPLLSDPMLNALEIAVEEVIKGKQISFRKIEDLVFECFDIFGSTRDYIEREVDQEWKN